MKIDIVSIFPEYFTPLDLSLVGRARTLGLLDVAVHDLRAWTHDVHRTVDDTPYGGGPGMVMRPEPWGEALDALTRHPADEVASAPSGEPASAPPGEVASVPSGEVASAPSGEVASAPSSEVASAPSGEVVGVPPAGGGVGSFSGRLVVPTPAGSPFTQAMAGDLASESHLIFACGRYEGIDQRVLEHAGRRMPVIEVSLGDYVLFGGEVAVLAMIEAIVRLLPGVLGNADSLVEESHAAGLLEAPVYTKPAVWRELPVPSVLRSGDHGRIARWRREQSLLRTAARRPDLLAALPPGTLDARDASALSEAGFQLSDPDVAE